MTRIECCGYTYERRVMLVLGEPTRGAEMLASSCQSVVRQILTVLSSDCSSCQHQSVSKRERDSPPESRGTGPQDRRRRP